MSEDQFLREFIDFCNKAGYGSDYSQVECIANFLHTIHQEYYEVEFIKLEDENEWGVDPPGGSITG